MLEERKVKIFLVTLIIALTAGIGIKAFVGFKAAPEPGPAASATLPAQSQTQGQNQNQTNTQTLGQEIVVYVTGAVAKPGLVKLTMGARLADALEAAGQTAASDITTLNLAEKLRDGEKIVVPKVGEVQAQTPGNAGQPGTQAAPASNQTGKINVNTAGATELDALPGIGPALADRIITYRDENGPFNQPEDLKQVPGIGDKKFADMQDMVTVN